MRFSNIAVVFDEASEAVHKTAEALARTHGATLHIFSTVDPPEWATAVAGAPGYLLAANDAGARARAIKVRAQQARETAAKLAANTQVTVRSGQTTASLLDFLSEVPIDLIVMSHEDVGRFSTMLHIDLTGQISRVAEVPVLAVGDDVESATRFEKRLRRVVVGAADAGDVCSGLEFAKALAAPDAEVTFARVGDCDEPSAFVAKDIEQAVASAGKLGRRTVRCIALEGTPSDALIKAADEHRADLLIVGSRRHQSLADRFRGTTADNILKNADRTAVLVVQHPVREHLHESSSLDRALSASMPASDPLPPNPGVD